MIVEKIENTFDQVARGGSNERFGIILFFGEGGGAQINLEELRERKYIT